MPWLAEWKQQPEARPHPLFLSCLLCWHPGRGLGWTSYLAKDLLQFCRGRLTSQSDKKGLSPGESVPDQHLLFFPASPPNAFSPLSLLCPLVPQHQEAGVWTWTLRLLGVPDCTCSYAHVLCQVCFSKLSYQALRTEVWTSLRNPILYYLYEVCLLSI